MARYQIGEAAGILGVSPDTVRRWVDSGRLRALRTEGGHRVIEGADLADLAVAHAQSLPPPAIGAESARNRMVGIVTAVTKDKVMAQVDIQAGPHRLVSLMSREAADQLALAPGVLAVASVKATNVVVELPRS